MSDSTARGDVRSFIEENFLYMHPGLALADEDDLLAGGIIDSLGFVELVDMVQTTYGIEVQDIEITEENFGSVAALVKFISARQNGK